MAVPGNFKPFTLAMVQLGQVTADKAANLAHCREMVRKAASGGEGYEQVDLVMLPEIFNSPVACDAHRPNAEPIPDVLPGQRVAVDELPPITESPTAHMLSSVARETGKWLIGGSIPEKSRFQADDDPRTWNTLTVWNPQGELVGKFRKLHMYDVDIPGGITMKESDVITPGDDVLVVDMPFGTIGLAICYDIRFPHLLSAMLEARPDICAYLLPAAFNCVTGPLAWEVLQRVRAIDNQIYVGMCSPAHDETNEYISYGHSMVCAPNGQIISTPTPEPQGECIVFAHITPQPFKECRERLPVWQSQRSDIYTAPRLIAKR